MYMEFAKFFSLCAHTHPYIICIHDLHDTLLEELGEDVAGDGGSFLHQGQLSILLYCHGVSHYSTDVNLTHTHR